jgi:PPOX class probable F420-dependent enzyme
MALADEKYVMFTTFRRDGRAVGTPVWVAELAPGEFGFTTGADSGKAKRLAHTPRVTLQGCDQRGKSTHGEVYEATARLVSGAETAPIRAAIRAKYGVIVPILGLAMTVSARLRRRPIDYGATGVIITLAGA